MTGVIAGQAVARVVHDREVEPAVPIDIDEAEGELRARRTNVWFTPAQRSALLQWRQQTSRARMSSAAEPCTVLVEDRVS